MKNVLLNDGNSIPSVGFGVFRIPNDGSTYRAVRAALDAGYRHIDTAAAYFNEAEVGKAVKDSGIPREEVFVTSKLWLQDYGFAAAQKGTERSLRKLGFDYIDLYLLHQPYGDVCGAWEALEEAKAKELVRSIGVSNMTPTLWNKFVPAFASCSQISTYTRMNKRRALWNILLLKTASASRKSGSASFRSPQGRRRRRCSPPSAQAIG